LIAQRKRLVDEWNAWRIRAKEDIAAETGGRGKKHAVKGGKAKEEEEAKEEIEVWIDEVIEQIEEEVIE
jgi:translation initiation factor 3 subunit B